MFRLEPRLTTVRTLAFSPDNRYLLAVGAKAGLGGLLTFDRLALYDLADPAAAPTLPIDDGLDPVAGFFLPDGRGLGVDNRGNWRVASVGGRDEPEEGRPDLPGRLDPVGVSPDGRWVGLVGREQFVCAPLGAGTAGRARWSLRAETQHEVSCAAFAPDGRRVAVGQVCTDGTPGPLGTGGVYEADTGRPVAVAAPGAHVLRLAWSPDGRFLVALGKSSFRACAADNLRSAALRYRSYIRLLAAAFHPAGQVFVTGDDAGRLLLWDTAEWEPVPGRPAHAEVLRPPARRIDWGVGAVQALAFSPDGSLGAVAGKRGEVVVWDAE